MNSSVDLDAYFAEIIEQQDLCGLRPQGHDWHRVYAEGGGRRSAVYERCDDCSFTKDEPPFEEWVRIENPNPAKSNLTGSRRT